MFFLLCWDSHTQGLSCGPTPSALNTKGALRALVQGRRLWEQPTLRRVLKRDRYNPDLFGISFAMGKKKKKKERENVYLPAMFISSLTEESKLILA